MERWKPYFWRSILVLIGLLVAALFLLLGFWRTILILLCCGIGYGVGHCKDKGISIIEKILSWRERWR